MKGVPGALLRYRIMAYIVGVLLIVLVCVGLPLKYFAGNDSVVAVAGTMHGFLYMVLLITAVDVGLRVRWPWLRFILIALAGTVPFVTFVAEHFATKSVRAWLAERAAEEQGEPGSGAPAVDPSA